MKESHISLECDEFIFFQDIHALSSFHSLPILYYSPLYFLAFTFEPFKHEMVKITEEYEKNHLKNPV